MTLSLQAFGVYSHLSTFHLLSVASCHTHFPSRDQKNSQKIAIEVSVYFDFVGFFVKDVPFVYFVEN
jgi:hypothetical protein